MLAEEEEELPARITSASRIRRTKSLQPKQDSFDISFTNLGLKLHRYSTVGLYCIISLSQLLLVAQLC